MSDLFAVDAFLRPAFVVVLPAIGIYVVVLSLLGWSRTRRWARPFLPFLRLVLLAGLCLALAAPALREAERHPGRIEIAVDVSRSLGDEGRAWSQRRVLDLIESVANREPEREIDLVVFASKARRVVLGPAGELRRDEIAGALAIDADDPIGPLASRLAPAMSMLASAGSSGVERHRLVMTDGALELPPDLIDIDPATRVALLPLPAFADRNVRLLALDLPERVVEGEGVPLRLRYRAAVAGPREIVLAIDGKEVRRVSVELAAGEQIIEFPGRDFLPEAGRHRFEARLEGDDGEPLDDRRLRSFTVVPLRHPLFVAGTEHVGRRESAPLRALRAQGREPQVLAASEARAETVDWNRISAVVLDRVRARELDADFASEVARHVDDGGGLVLLADSREGSLLAWNEHRLGPWLPLRGLPLPPKPPKPEPKEPPPPPRPEDPKKLEDPDPDKAKFEEVDAPTLAMVLVIDKSPSMKRDGRLHNAKLGAIATARELHPEDGIGVVTFHEVGVEAVPIQPAANLATIEAEIMRIRSGGRGTDIERALEKAREMLSYEDAAVKLVILMSDGGSSIFNVKKTMERMVADGITVATVGVGSNFNSELLTLIGLYGGGGAPIPARSGKEIPSVLVDLTSGMMAKKKVRNRKDFDRSQQAKKRAEKEKAEKEKARLKPERRVEDETPPKDAPPPKPADKADEKARILFEVERGVTYTDDLPWGLVPPLEGLHGAREKSGAWVSLRAEDSRPVLAHWRVGDGLAAMLATAPEGAFVGSLPLWEGYGPWLGQLLRFVERDPDQQRFRFEARDEGDALQILALDAWARDRERPWDLRVSDQRGEVAVSGIEAMGEGRFLLRTARPLSAPWARITGGPPEEEGVELETECSVALPEEIRRRGLDLEGLERWRRAVSGRFVADVDEFLAESPEDRVEEALVPRLRGLGLALLALFVLDLLAKRLGRREDVIV